MGRAKITPLHIETTVSEGNIREIQRTLQLAHRIQAIHLLSSVENIQPLLQILTHPNPALETLDINVQFPDGSISDDVYDPPTFPTDGPKLEHLRHMTLRGTPFYLLTSRCTALRHLHLCDLPITGRPSLRYFLFMLEKMVDLEYFIVDRAFPLHCDASDVLQALGLNGQRVSLPRLKALALNGSVAEIATILECFSLPSSCRISCTISTVSGLDWQIDRLAEALKHHTFASKSIFETVVLDSSESCSRFKDDFESNELFRQTLRLRVFKGAISPSSHEDDSIETPSLDLTISPQEYYLDDAPMIRALSSFWLSLPFSKVHTLAVHDVDIITQKTWALLFQNTPSLRVLDITGVRPPSGLAWALLLNTKYQAREGGTISRFLVPKLMDVYLRNVDCSLGGFMVAAPSPHTKIPINAHQSLDDSRFLDVLIACFKSRRKSGLCLRSLSLSRCDFVYKSAVEEARGVVQHLVCDLRNVKREVIGSDDARVANGLVPFGPHGGESAKFKAAATSAASMGLVVVDPVWPARYWGGAIPPQSGEVGGVQIKHYYRLRTLLSM